MLQDLIAKHLANNLAEFEGLHITGTVPVRTDLVNAVIADVLTNGLPGGGSTPSATDGPSASAAGASSSGGKLPVDRATLETLLRTLVKRAEITAENGAITLHFEVRR